METRPTGDRVREAAFNLIGADRAVFVESDRDASRGIERNLEKLGLTGARVICDDVLRFLASERGSYDLILVDPPYEMVESLQMRLSHYLPALLAENGLVVFETSARDEPELPLAQRTSRRYGSARLTLFEHFSRSSGPTGGSGPEGIVLGTAPESTGPPVGSGGSGGRLRRPGGAAGEGREE